MTRKRFTVVIPHYREEATEVAGGVASVRGQMGVDLGEVEVLICTDGGGVGIGQELSSMSWVGDGLEIREVTAKENGGPGVMRQMGIEHARGEWLVFMDADDSFHNTGVLYAFDKEIRRSAPDVVTSRWLEELKREGDGSFTYIEHAHDVTWMHGKAFRTEWVRATGERHEPTLRVHEDSYILKVWEGCAPRRAQVEGTTYVWRWRDDSTVRRNGGIYSYESMPEWVRAIGLASGRLRARGVKTESMTQPLLYVYFMTQEGGWRTDTHKGHLLALRRAIVEHWGKWFGEIPPSDSEAFRRAYNAERARVFRNGLETEPWTEWFGALREEAGAV